MKRSFDIFLFLTGIFLSFPLWLLIAFLIYFEDRGSIFFIQHRVGRGGRLFRAFNSVLRMDNSFETSPVLLKPPRRAVFAITSELKGLTLRHKTQLLKEHLFPPAEYMLRKYSIERRILLPFFYVIAPYVEDSNYSGNSDKFCTGGLLLFWESIKINLIKMRA